MTIIEMLSSARFKIEGTPTERVEAYHLVKRCMILLAADYPAKMDIPDRDLETIEKTDHISTFKSETRPIQEPLRKRIRNYLSQFAEFPSLSKEAQEYSISILETQFQCAESGSELLLELVCLHDRSNPTKEVLEEVGKLFQTIKETGNTPSI